jgi:hypothetical protein
VFKQFSMAQNFPQNKYKCIYPYIHILIKSNPKNCKI